MYLQSLFPDSSLCTFRSEITRLRASLQCIPHLFCLLSRSPSVFHTHGILLASRCCSVAQSRPTLCDAMDCSRLPCPSPSPRAFSNSCPLSQWCHPTISSSVIPSSSCPVFPSIRVFSNESALHIKWPKYGSFSFSISPSSEYSGLLSSRIDWLNLLAVQGTLKSLLQRHSSKTSILQAQAFFNLPFQPRGFLSLRASAHEM